MKRRQVCAFVLLFVFLGSCISQAVPQSQTKGSFLQLCYDLWKRTEFGWTKKETERAAWVIRDPEGKFRWMEWKFTDEHRASTWKGDIPAGVIAQVHTHPQLTSPEPSEQDRQVAQKIKIPIYTISAFGIWKAAPDGKVSQEADKNWYKGLKEMNE